MKKEVSRGVVTTKKRKAMLKRLFKENDVLWSRAVKILANEKSEKPASEEELENHGSNHLNSHHVYHKQQYGSIRWDVRNGVCIYSWQHVLARGSAHDDPIVFDQWALPYLEKRGDLEYLKKRSLERVSITPTFIAEENVRLREEYVRLTGQEFVYGKKMEKWSEDV